MSVHFAAFISSSVAAKAPCTPQSQALHLSGLVPAQQTHVEPVVLDLAYVSVVVKKVLRVDDDGVGEGLPVT
jgi:hypothetical protein